MDNAELVVYRAAAAPEAIHTRSAKSYKLPDIKSKNFLDSEHAKEINTIRACFVARDATLEDFFRRVVDAAVLLTRTIENGIENMAERHELEITLRRIILSEGLQ